MDLIYTDVNRNELGVLQDYKLDLAYGSDENDFELTVHIDNAILQPNYWIYIEGTEYGGIVDTVEVDTANKKVIYKGRTGQGVIASKIVEPDANSDYWERDSITIFGVADNIIDRVKLQSLINVKAISTPRANNAKAKRYDNAYNVITSILKDNDYKITLTYGGAKIQLTTIPISIYDDDIISDKVDFKITKKYNPANHVICLGKGELKDREVYHLYSDADGNISETQTYTNTQEVTIVYDNANAESVDELKKGGREKLLEDRTDSVDVTLKSNDIVFDIGDKITATEQTTGITVNRTITKKIVTIEKSKVSINYTVGE